ncbi:MAG: methylated-DNA--[protein]-cysteine S-methyltransferase [Chlamydiae bacterium]|nr:methylated-DNA--[protein]-cysteine S-methyltransferase [Chlamydiota bacterium]
MIAKTPKIRVIVECENLSIKRVVLTPFSSFDLLFQGKLPKEDEEKVLKWLHHYSNGKQTPINFPLSLNHLTPFSQLVLRKLQTLEFGKKLAYSALAKEVGKPKSARPIGRICHINPFPLFIPCHRIIAANGKLGGFGFGESLKSELLSFERAFKKSL